MCLLRNFPITPQEQATPRRELENTLVIIGHYMEKAAPSRERLSEDQRLAWNVAWVVAVAPTFADAIVNAVNPKLALGLLGKRAGGLDCGGLGGVNGGSTRVAFSDRRPSAVGTMRDMIVLFGHRSLLSTLGVTPRSGIA